MEARRATVAGVPMRWLEEGAGAPVVFVHGLPTSPALWRRVLPRVRGARRLAWEMVGYGASLAEGAGRELSLARQAEWLLAWLEHLGVGRALLVGHDVGGGVAQIAAVRRPERVAGLVLASSAAYGGWPAPELKGLRALGPLLRRVPPRPFARAVGACLRRGHDDAAQAAESASVHAACYGEPEGPAGFARQIAALDARDTLAVSEELARLGKPARLVWGAADRLQPLRQGERLARELGAPFERIPGARHFTPEDHPDALARAVRSVLAEPAAGLGGPGE